MRQAFNFVISNENIHGFCMIHSERTEYSNELRLQHFATVLPLPSFHDLALADSVLIAEHVYQLRN